MEHPPHSQQPTFAPCPRCGGKRIAGYGYDGRNPLQKRGLIFRTFGKGKVIAPMTLLACINCGYTEWYTSVEDLARGFQMNPEEFPG